ncbi:Glycosyltransferase family 50 protein [Venustampulla echinocandica]|uniref:GPI mannosyltransferase 1 n=1 Tax=Venustampulla echinocandica TaxID=2656787 RepID=A0A370TFC7_9HELO|nr:Glycosyltransferase family 50 protein [Venustampulla echinocandica]RDL33603.1 Glycosyltransferase family 50 protein [Venustampulla echinocandica]
MSRFFASPVLVFSSAIALRVVLFFYGLWQDANSPVKYTDIDYFVFTDAARFTAHTQGSPYDRETYRYTPLLAWMLWPTTWSGTWFSFGKALFAVGDIIAGWLIVIVLQSSNHMSLERALKFASLWLLNPMVATISTRGSSEGLLGVMVIALLWAITQKRISLAGVLLGLGVHFKIYPFIYASSIIWWLDDERVPSHTTPSRAESSSIVSLAMKFCNSARIRLVVISLLTFTILNTVMYSMHNFSPYNTLLYLSSSGLGSLAMNLESLAFLPQLLLSAVILPLVLAKKDLPSTMLAQTFAFVAFNKVCTSQYFLWYMVFLPFYLPNSSLLANKFLGLSVAALWVATQGLWLHQGFQLEFLGKSTFVPGLWVAGILFFLTNAWILGIIVLDIGSSATKSVMKPKARLSKS